MKELIAKIEAYGFECEAGELKDCVEWKKLTTVLIMTEDMLEKSKQCIASALSKI